MHSETARNPAVTQRVSSAAEIHVYLVHMVYTAGQRSARHGSRSSADLCDVRCRHDQRAVCIN